MKDNYNSAFAGDYTTELGSVHDGMRSTGKKAFDWTFTAPRPDGTDFVVDIKIMILRATGNFSNAKKSKPLRFSASHEFLDHEIEHTDLTVLREMIDADIKAKLHRLTTTVWEDWLEVKVSGSESGFGESRFSGMGAELKINVNRLKKGWYKGKAYTIHRNNVCVPFPKPQKIGSDPDMRNFRHRDGEICYIKETPENIAALESIRDRMGEIKSKLAEVLSQDRAQESLADIKSLPLIKKGA